MTAANAMQAAVLASSPWAAWALNDASGSTAADYSGNGKTGNYSGTYAPATPGPFNWLSDSVFSSTGAGYINCGTQTLNFMSNGISFEAWMYLNSISGYQVAFGMSEFLSLSMFVDPSGIVWFQVDNATSLNPISAGQWYHLVGTYGTVGGCLVYVNGVPGSSEPYVGNSATQTLTIGATMDTSGTPTGFVNGYIAYPAIYLSELSAATVVEHYTEGLSTFRGGFLAMA